MTESGKPIERGDVVWTPPADALETSRVGDFLRWVAEHRGRRMTTHDELWEWSVADLDGFWSAIWEYYGVWIAPGVVEGLIFPGGWSHACTEEVSGRVA